MIHLTLISFFSVIVATAFVAKAQDTPKPILATAERALTTAGAKKQQIRHSMIGVTSTRIFYTLADQKAVLVLLIDNADTRFLTTATVILFAPDASEEGIAKWINNQHSDALFIDSAEPILTTKLPAGICAVTKHEKIVGEQIDQLNQTSYLDYKVKISIKSHLHPGQFKLAAFEDDANVLVQLKTS